MRYRIAATAVLSLVVLTYSCGGNSSSNANTGPVNIGAIFSLTGAAGVPGTGRLDGVEVAVDDINNAGGILGRKVHLVTEDTASDPVDATTVARQMLATANLQMVTGLTALDYPDALPIFCSANPPIVMFENVADPALDQKSYKYCYRAVPSDALEGTAMAYAASQLGYKTLALGFTASAESATIQPSIQAAANKLGMSIVTAPQLPTGVPTYDSEVSQIIQAKPDAIVVSLLPSEASTFFKSLERLGGSNIPVIGSDTSLVTEWVNAVGASVFARQVVGVQPSSTTQGPGASAFYPVFQTKFGKPARANSAQAYDSVIVGALAMTACKSTDPTAYNACITQVTDPVSTATQVYTYTDGVNLLKQGKRIKYVGISSPMIYNQYHDITGGFEIDKITNGNITTVQTLSAESLAQVIK